jgi:hypothetical protein
LTVDITAEVLIARPRSEVAAFMFEPRNDARWTRAVVECRPLSPGPLRTGAKVERVTKFLGRRMSYLFEVMDHGEDRFVELRVDEPFPMHIRYELADHPSGTQASIRCQGEGSRFFRMAGPLLSRMVRRNIRQDLANLKQCLEAPSA